MALSVSDQLRSVSSNFKSFVEHPDKFLKAQDNIIEGVKSLIKDAYDVTKRIEESTPVENKESLPELLIQGFDDEQIWQQLELQNKPVLNRLISAVSIFKAKKDNLEFFPSVKSKTKNDFFSKKEQLANKIVKKKKGIDDKEIDSEELDDEELDDEALDDEELDDEELDDEELDDEELDDEEFDNEKLDDEELDDEELDEQELNIELHEELESEKVKKKSANKNEKKVIIEGEDSEDDDVGYDEEEAARELFGKGEIDSASRKRKAEYESDYDENDEPKSTFERRQERLRHKIDKLEDEILAEKPWQMKGEISGSGRPKNSLLEEVLEYQDTSRPAPIDTGETSLKLEDIIKQRIKDQVWDDVQRKVKPVKGPLEFKKKLALDQEKSKLSLAQIYEQEFVKQRDALNPELADAPEEVPKEHEDISKMMTSLFRKLDALSNYHYTPKSAIPELKIISNLPAISVEEVAPVSVSDAALLAPEEIKRKQKGDLIGKDERTKTDKKRERRKKKQLQKKKRLEKEAREEEKRSKKAVPDVF